MKYKGYEAVVFFDDEAGIFYGEVANVRDVITFQGESVAELQQAFADSVEDYLAFCAERGEKPEKPFSDSFLSQLDRKLPNKFSNR
ncbi:MAG: type II toxin-antitoxin system HicB family antitoxin [Microcystis sp.]|jgi:predicted HicB family RNase H-like nuclease|uniref:Type II toxin-antitoxin system HicB family antitoxin n=2 Tax=Microcystaceae TaxID=1890449 RepID=A0A552L8S6_9CHRO|nr:MULTISPECIES: type II toxin-antitoxin system HicB family antitoxin [unclassified Microcystis]MCA2817328.1 type II toxin-antitoxin system HicB family antitoxin [Microcystis sp. M085S1]MCA2854761.1 type II toxin-antitoxin system HicB family antitoxin [Microcystis sp. M065S1]MCZ8057399.1 type II toxin-antitoxin system HicB family antitoxin [Microcystis sp. LE19-12.2C]MDJ0551145.1 type II toxin-antitoxin system HicB family antitoxin [Microcystis sp. M49637_WE12]TRT93744.1 MAG: type II toxin-ant